MRFKKDMQVTDGATIACVLDDLKLQPTATVVERNAQIVERTTARTTTIGRDAGVIITYAVVAATTTL